MDDDLDRAAREVAELAARAQAELDAMVAASAVTFEAVLALQQWFNAEFTAIMVRHLSVVPGGDIWGVQQVGDMLVGDVALSRKLYVNARQTAHEVTALVRQHAQGVQQARELALRLYDGYDPQDGIRRPLEGAARAKLPKALRLLTAQAEDRAALQAVYEQGMRYAATLKTEPIKAAYMEAFDRWRKGGGADALRKRLEVAHEEKSRYMANRIAQTELARAHQHALGAELMADESIAVVQVVLSGSHPKRDICDLHARADLFKLGAGCYPKAKTPRPPFHPFCRCRLRSRPDLDADDAREVKGGPAAYLRDLPVHDGAQVMGSRAKLQRTLNGGDMLEIVNAGVPDGYRTVRLGDVAAPARKNEAVNKAYEEAKAGGPHAGLLRNIRATQGVDQLRAGIKGYTKRIQDHEGWIADPFSKHGVSGYPAEDVARWVNQKWPADIERLKAQRDIYEGVLKEKEDGSVSGGD